MTDRDANDILMGGGVTSAAFPEIGTTVSGRICWGPEARQQTDMDTGEPKTFPNGDPMMQIIVHLETAERDPANPDDDGTRALYIKFNLLNAVRAAVKTGRRARGFLPPVHAARRCGSGAVRGAGRRAEAGDLGGVRPAGSGLTRHPPPPPRLYLTPFR
jgi:hypothetical protein